MTVPISLVNDKVPRSSFLADGAQVAFPCDWPVRTYDVLKIVFNDDEAPGIAYNVVGINDSDGFTVFFGTPPADGTRITIYRDSPLERQNDYGQQTEFSAQAINAELAGIVMLLQERAMLTGRTIRLPISDPVAEMVLPPVGERANRFAFFDPDGQLTTAGGTIETILDFSQYAQENPVAQDLIVFNRVASSGNRARSATLTQLEQALRLIRHKPYYDALDVGLAGDGVTDDSFPLQVAMDFRSSQGGGTFFLRAPVDGGSFYFAHSPRVPSNITLNMASPFLLAKGVTVRIAGSLALVGGADAFKLQAAATAGATSIVVDTAPYGGGQVTSYFAVGDWIQITGKLDGCGTPIEQQELQITALNGSTNAVGVDAPLAYAYAVTYPADAYEANYKTANQTRVAKIVRATMTVDLPTGDNLVQIRTADIGKLVATDLVLIKDDRTTDDAAGAAGSASAPVGEEMALIVPSLALDASWALRLDRRVERRFRVSERARLFKVNPVVGSAITGARFLSAEAPDLSPAAPVDWFEIRYARNCSIEHAVVPNTDEYGKRGDAFVFYRAYDCWALNVEAARAKYVADGEGGGIVFRWSTSCWATGGLMESMRRSMRPIGATNCQFREIVARNPREAPFAPAGCEERSVIAYDCVIDGGTAMVDSEGRPPTALAFGSATYLGGSFGCGWVGGRISNLAAASPLAAIRFFPGAVGCFVRDAEFFNIGQLLSHEDTPSYGTVVASGNRIEGVSVDGCALPRMIYIQGRANGATVDTLVDTKISLRSARNIHGGIRAINVTELEIEDSSLDEVTVDGSASYAIEVESVTGLTVRECDFTGMGNGIKATNTSLRVIDVAFNDQPASVVYYDGGGNTGSWVDSRNTGFTATAMRGGSILTEGPRLIGAQVMADDTAFAFKPAQKMGECTLFSTAGKEMYARFFYDLVNGRIDLGPFTTPLVQTRTGALTGTTGGGVTDGWVTVSVDVASGSLYFQQRTGLSMTVDGATS